jgi:hypothetical protein
MEDYYQLQRYKDQLGNVPPYDNYDGIWDALEERRHYISRHAPTHRVFEESGVNKLLDQMNALLLGQCIETLEGEANGE